MPIIIDLPQPREPNRPDRREGAPYSSLANIIQIFIIRSVLIVPGRLVFYMAFKTISRLYISGKNTVRWGKKIIYKFTLPAGAEDAFGVATGIFRSLQGLRPLRRFAAIP